MKRRMFLGVCGVVATIGCTGNEPDDVESTSADAERAISKSDAVVTITDSLSFDPEMLEIDSGQTVVWKNESSTVQTVTAYSDQIPDDADYFSSGDYNSEALATMIYPFGGKVGSGETYTNTFEISGTYTYYSIPSEHLSMTGSIVVN